MSTAPETVRFQDLRNRCALAHARLHANPLDNEYRSALDRMITCDEGIAFADYRDQLILLGADAWRENRITRRAMRLSSDELAAAQRGGLR